VFPRCPKLPTLLTLQHLGRDLREGGDVRQASEKFVCPHDEQSLCGKRVEDVPVMP
jgi:hypothetical protein